MEFATVFGQDDVLINEQELVDFNGDPHRSVGNDKMNELNYSKNKTWLKFLIGILFVVFAIGCEIGFIIGLMYLILYFGI